VELGGVERSVIDTGADVNVISKKIVDSQGWTKYKKKTNEQIMGVNGHTTETEEIIELPITICRWTPKKKIKFFVLDTNEFHTLLGTGFLKKYKCSLNYENGPPIFSWKANEERRTIKCEYQMATNHLGWKKSCKSH
jgi:predicted aspartyl protease